MKKGKSIFFAEITAFSMLLIITSCSNINKKKMIAELMETDLSFSEMSGDKGVKKAFLNYIDTTELYLANSNIPIDGKNAVIHYFSNSSDSGYVVSWKPLGANIVATSNIGYTYGIYQVASIDSVSKGTYVTVWKKAKNGRWKFILDSQNKGI